MSTRKQNRSHLLQQCLQVGRRFRLPARNPNIPRPFPRRQLRLPKFRKPQFRPGIDPQIPATPPVPRLPARNPNIPNLVTRTMASFRQNRKPQSQRFPNRLPASNAPANPVAVAWHAKPAALDRNHKAARNRRRPAKTALPQLQLNFTPLPKDSQ